MGRHVTGQYIITDDGAVYRQCDPGRYATHVQIVAYSRGNGWYHSELYAQSDAMGIALAVDAAREHSELNWAVWYMRE